jgi:hypothetical protein
VADDEAPEAAGLARRSRAETDDGRHDRFVAAAARRAAMIVAAFTNHEREGVISVERNDGTWKIGVEVVETRRIPDTADILAIYEVRLDQDGELVSYRRTLRYARGQVTREYR